LRPSRRGFCSLFAGRTHGREDGTRVRHRTVGEPTEAGGPPGYEGRIREIVRRELGEVTDTMRTDGMGNVVGTIDLLAAFLETETGDAECLL
jgi:hypothetical protein